MYLCRIQIQKQYDEKTLVFLLVLSFTAVQARQWGVEVGVNYPIPIHNYAEEGNRLGFYVQGIYRLPNSAWELDAKFSHEVYPSAPQTLNYLLDNGTLLPYEANMEGHSNVFQLGAVYRFLSGEKVSPYLGAALGVSSDQLRYKDEHSDRKLHVIAGPKLGVLLFQHLNVSFQTSLSKSDYSRMMFNVGYRF